jgi:hypothetical protein
MNYRLYGSDGRLDRQARVQRLPHSMLCEEQRNEVLEKKPSSKCRAMRRLMCAFLSVCDGGNKDKGAEDL